MKKEDLLKDIEASKNITKDERVLDERTMLTILNSLDYLVRNVEIKEKDV